MKVGFVGLGNMGWPMAANLARAGHALVVRDLEADRQRRFAGEYSCVAATEPAAFAAVAVLVTMLPTGGIVREVLLEWSGGIARALKRGTVVIDMSSSEPAGTRRLGADLGTFGVALVDAPVSGGVPRATDGTLSIMIGADDAEAAARARPVLEKLGGKFFATGSLGTGHAMKALNNFCAAAGYTAAAEALIAGRRFGLDPAVMVDVLNASTGRNFSTEFAMKDHVLSGRFATGFMLGLLAKDIGIAADLAAEMDLDAPLSKLLKQRWAETLAKSGPTVDHTAAIRYWDEPERGKP
jgi:3-hydroxyisobutyrate dehydrogenase